ncbi:MAG: hypothetical protein LBL52_02745 [Rickettsiales bacterium]|nr:hypothetical protein [Rickettsiales bacterium]
MFEGSAGGIWGENREGESTYIKSRIVRFVRLRFAMPGLRVHLRSLGLRPYRRTCVRLSLDSEPTFRFESDFSLYSIFRPDGAKI